jgi:nucleotide-binding universal stress UspA family protein
MPAPPRAALPRRILVGYAGSQSDRDAVAFAGMLAGRLQSAVLVAFPYSPVFTRDPADVVEARVRAEVTPLLREAGCAQDPTCHWTGRSWPIHGLHDLAEYDGAELLVVGSDGSDGLVDRAHVGAMVRLVHGAPCAVAVVPAGWSQARSRGLDRVGVGFTPTPEGGRALALAERIAAEAGGRLHVIAAVGIAAILSNLGFSPIPSPGYLEAMLETTRFELAGALTELAPEIPISHSVVEGDPAAILIERSADLDLLVLGSRAYGPVRHALLGGVSSRVMREAACPVIIVPRGAATASAAGDDAAGEIGGSAGPANAAGALPLTARGAADQAADPATEKVS